VLQGVERYRDRDIVYSLGNFVFGANSQPADMDSMIAQARFRFRAGRLTGVEQTLIPVRISTDTRYNDFRPVVLEGDERARVLDKIDTLSRKLGPPRSRPGGPVLSAAEQPNASRTEG
jgi:poly-gamma-glutamate synthesis protein (capsule biosynthesis protein)